MSDSVSVLEQDEAISNLGQDDDTEVASSAETLQREKSLEAALYAVPMNSPYWKKFERIAVLALWKIATKTPLHLVGGPHFQESSLDARIVNRMITIAEESASWRVVDINECGGDALLEEIGLRWWNPKAPEHERRKLQKGFGVDAVMVGYDNEGKVTDIILFQTKAYKDIDELPLHRFQQAQGLVEKHLGMKPIGVVVVPHWSKLNSNTKEFLWDPNGLQERMNSWYLFRLHTPEATPEEAKVCSDDGVAQKHVLQAIATAEEEAEAEMKKKEDGASAMAARLCECERQILNPGPASNIDLLRKNRQQILLECAFGKGRVAHIDQYGASIIIDAMMGAYNNDPERNLFYCWKLTDARLKNILLADLGLPCLPWDREAVIAYGDGEKIKNPNSFGHSEALRRRENFRAVKEWKKEMSKEYTQLKKDNPAKVKEYEDLVKLSGSRVASFFAPTGCGKSACIAYAVTNWFSSSSSAAMRNTRRQTSKGRKIAIVFTKQLDALRQLANDIQPAMSVRFGKGWRRFCAQMACKEIVGALEERKDSNLTVKQKYDKCLQSLRDDKDKDESEDGLRIIYCTEASSLYGFQLLSRACELGYRTLVVKDEAHHHDKFEDLGFELPSLEEQVTLLEHAGVKRKHKAGPSSEGQNDPPPPAEPAPIAEVSEKARGKRKATESSGGGEGEPSAADADSADSTEKKKPRTTDWSAAALSLAEKTEGCLAFVSTATPSKRLETWCERTKARKAISRSLEEAIKLRTLCDYGLVLTETQFRKKGSDDDWTAAGADGDKHHGDKVRYGRKAETIVADMKEVGDRRAIVWCNNSGQAKLIQKLLVEECEKAGFGCWAELCTSEEASDPKQRINNLYFPFQHRPVQETKDSKITLYFLIGIHILDESLNLPYAERGVILDLSDDVPTHEMIIRFFQRLGRLLRHHPEKPGSQKTLMICSSWDCHLDTLLYYLQKADSGLFGVDGKPSKVRVGSSNPSNPDSDRRRRRKATLDFALEWRDAPKHYAREEIPRGNPPKKDPPKKKPKPEKSPEQIAKEQNEEKLKGATLRPFKPGAFPPFPYCDKYRLGTCCGEKHNVSFSRLHTVPKALYKAVVDATTDDERAAAVSALEEYEGSNGSCAACTRAANSESVLAKYKEYSKKKKPYNKCNDPFGKGCTGRATGSCRPCPDCKEEQKRQAAGAGAGSSTDPLPSS